jgi:hypothetical protein
MNSATSTNPRAAVTPARPAFQPWQFFVVATFGCALAAAFVARGRGITVVALLGVIMCATALVGITVWRTLHPLASKERERTPMVGHRTRLALEREKGLTLRAIKDLEFDHAMGKLSDSDWREMSDRLRARAAGLMRQLDAGLGYREEIERDLEKRLKTTDRSLASQSNATCAVCAAVNDGDARFCKHCGATL